MSINVGDVEAILRLKDEFSGVIQQAMSNSTGAMAKGVAGGQLLADAIEKVGSMAVEAAKELVAMATEAVAAGTDLYNMSLRTGASVESLSALKFVAGETGSDIGTVTNSMFRMQVALGQAADGSGKAGIALRRLGLDARELAEGAPDQALIRIMSALHDLPTQAERSKIGMQIFSRGFRNMAGMAQEDIQGLIKEAERLGVVMTTEEAAAMRATTEEVGKLQEQWEGLRNHLMAAVAPAIVAIAKVLNELQHDAIEKLGLKTIDWGKVTKETVTFILNGLASLVEAFGGVMSWANSVYIVLGNIRGASLVLVQLFEHLGLAVLYMQKVATLGLTGSDSIALMKQALKENEKAWTDQKVSIDKAAQARDSWRDKAKPWADSLGDAAKAVSAAKTEIDELADKSHAATKGADAHAEALKRETAATVGLASAVAMAREAGQRHVENLNTPLGGVKLDDARVLVEQLKGMASDAMGYQEKIARVVAQGHVDMLLPLLAQMEPEGDEYKKLLDQILKAQTSYVTGMIDQSRKLAAETAKENDKWLKVAVDTYGQIKKLMADAMAAIGRTPEGYLSAKGYNLQSQLAEEDYNKKIQAVREQKAMLQAEIAGGHAGPVYDQSTGKFVTAQQQMQMLQQAEDALLQGYQDTMGALNDAWVASGQSAEEFTGTIDSVTKAAKEGAQALSAYAGAVQAGPASSRPPGTLSGTFQFSAQPGWTPNQPGPWGGGGGGQQSQFGGAPTFPHMSQAPSWSEYNPWGWQPWWGNKAVPFAEGGRVTSPTLALIGEAGPETVVPDSKLSGGGISVHIDARGSSFQTPQDVARVADKTRDGLLEALRAKGYRV
ncbi:MAG: hypothetical protein ABFD60_01580 [Bryobacteraceae bacterium]